MRYFKYLTVDKDLRRWGVYLTGAGHIQVDKNTEYPLIDDPTHHYFHWSTGRRLSDYQVLYITRGKGIFESDSAGVKKISAGDMFILFPGIWHRFAPDKATGWEEYWVEFNGDVAKHFQTKGFINSSNPVVKVGVQEEIVENYLKIIKLIKDEIPGFQYIAAGNFIQIMGLMVATKKYNPFRGKPIENQIKQAKLVIFENMYTSLSLKEISRTVGLGYSLFRKKFKEYTGVSPAQYQINLRIQEAKEILIRTNLSLKEISHNLGFESQNYFYRQFRQKTGYTPSEFRNKNKREIW